MDEAFIEHAQHDVDGENGGGDLERHVFQRGLELLRGALETAGDGGGHVQGGHGQAHGFGGIAEGRAGGQIEG